jgi:hypothetical protein
MCSITAPVPPDRTVRQPCITLTQARARLAMYPHTPVHGLVLVTGDVTRRQPSLFQWHPDARIAPKRTDAQRHRLSWPVAGRGRRQPRHAWPRLTVHHLLGPGLPYAGFWLERRGPRPALPHTSPHFHSPYHLPLHLPGKSRKRTPATFHPRQWRWSSPSSSRPVLARRRRGRRHLSAFSLFCSMPHTLLDLTPSFCLPGVH